MSYNIDNLVGSLITGLPYTDADTAITLASGARFPEGTLQVTIYNQRKNAVEAFNDGEAEVVECSVSGNTLTISEWITGKIALTAGIEWIAALGATKDLLESLDNSLVESGESIFFLEDEADPVISGYKVMDNPAQLEAKATVTESTVVDEAIIQEWITDVGLPGTTFIPAGTWQFKINAYKTGGSKTVKLYNELYKRAEGGTETLIATTANSIALTDSEVDLPAFNIYVPALTILATDRLVTKTRIRLIGGGSDPTSVTVAFSGETAARLSIPAQAIDATQYVKKSEFTTATAKADFTDTDSFLRWDSVSGALRRFTWANLITALKALFAPVQDTDTWVLTTSFTGGASPISSNLSRFAHVEKIGDGMTQASGVFTFPRTGIWNVKFVMYAQTSSILFFGSSIRVITDASGTPVITNRADLFDEVDGDGFSISELNGLEVTATEDIKVQFTVTAESTGVTTIGNTGTFRTGMIFTRIGDL